MITYLKDHVDRIKKDPEQIQRIQKKLIRFTLDIQITEQDKRLCGGWMRAFDVETDEYYGCDKDYGWGAYCILTGWVTGAIPIVFLDMLGLPTIY